MKGIEMNKHLNIRIVLLCLAALLCLVPLVSCSTEELGKGWVPAGMQQASGDDMPYRMFVPTQWKVGSSDGAVTAYSEDASVSFTQVFFKELVKDGKNPTLTEYYESYIPSMKESVKDLEFLTEGEDMIIDGTFPAKKYVYTGTVGGVSCKFMQVLFYAEKDMYLFTFTAAADNYQTYEESVNKILSNLLFSEKAAE